MIHVEKIATPQMRLPILNNFTQYLPDENIMAGVSFSSLGKDAALYFIDSRTLDEEKILLPDGVSCGHHGFQKGRGNIFYIASTNGCLYEFELEQKKFKKLIRLMRLMDKSFICGSHFSSSGKVYVGRWPDGNFWEYDTDSGQAKRYETIPGIKKGLYCSDFIDLPDGRMLILTSGVQPAVIMYNPETGERSIVSRGNPENESRGFFNGIIDEERILVNFKYYGGVRVFNWRSLSYEGVFSDIPEYCYKMEKVDGDYYCSGFPSGSMYRIKDGKAIKVWGKFPDGNLVNNFHYLGKGEFVCMGDNGLAMKLNLNDGTMVSRQVDNVSQKGMGLQFLYKVPDNDFVIGAHFICSQMFRINLKNKACEPSLNKVVSYGGQVNCGTAMNGKFYLGSYVHAVISEYDWKQPFVFGKNPSVIGEIGEGQNRPIDMANDGEFVYIATGAQYGMLGGAITVLNPVTLQMKVYRNFVSEQNPTCLFIRPDKNLLAGGTDISGDCDTAEPRASSAVLFLWDTKQRKTVYQWAPWKISRLSIIDITSSGVCLGLKNPPGKEGEEFFLWDIEKGSFEIKPWPLKGIFISGLFMNEREFYGATENGLFVLDIKNGKYEMLTHTTKITGSYCHRCFEKINSNEFLFDIEGVNIMKTTIKHV